ncbi:MAG: trypsin-like peptidase domain-containing protein, partial [Chloroflexota bacterium]|nr:trypsin-like peptidase domain-containing protein [Chloroflexota bacterium]
MDSSSLPPNQGGDSPSQAGGALPQEPVTQPQPTGAPYYQPPTPPARESRLAPWMPPVLVLVAVALVIAGVAVGLALSRNNNAAAASTLAAAPVATLPVTSGAQDLQSQVINVIRAVQPTVVQIQSQSGQGQGIGSGEIVSSDGYIVTNDHVVRGYTSYSVLLSNGKSYPATLVGEAPGDDLAMLKISTGAQLQTIAFGESKQAQVGQFVIALGSP